MDAPDDHDRKAMLRDVAARQKAWLTRGKSKGTAWRPRRFHRVAAKGWLANLDNQYRLISGRAGLSFFKPNYSKALWKDWRSQPLCVPGQDFGSDGLNGVHAGSYHFGLAMECFPDQSHAANRSVYMGMKSVGLGGIILLSVVSWNLPHGPKHEQLRYNQCKEHMKTCYDLMSPESCPLWLHVESRIIAAMVKMGYEFTSLHSQRAEAWEFMRNRSGFQPMGRKCCMARFHAVAYTLEYPLLLSLAFSV